LETKVKSKVCFPESLVLLKLFCNFCAGIGVWTQACFWNFNVQMNCQMILIKCRTDCGGLTWTGTDALRLCILVNF
jgi:hypothetical protein